MKKFFIVLGFSVLFAAFMCSVTENEDIVRIHIRANSNLEADQDVKFKVRDSINQYLTPILNKPKTKDEAVKVLNGELENLKNIAEEVSGEECNVTLGLEYFPEKTYNNEIYPEGEYTALIIEIGEGKGRNWWCVAFPNMCYTTANENKVQYKTFIVEILERIGIL